MACQLIGWLGSARQSKLHEHIQNAADVWAQQWSMNVKDFDVDADSVTDQWRATGRDQLVYRTSRGLLHIKYPAGFIAKLGAFLTNTRSGDTHGLADRVGLRAIKAFIQQICGGQSVEQLHDGVSADINQEQFALSPVYRLSFSGTDCTMRFSDSLLYSLVPKKPNRKVELHSRQDLVADKSVTLKLFIPLGEMALKEIRDIQVNEVLGINARLQDPLQIVDENGAQLGMAMIQSNDGPRSIQFNQVNIRES